MNVAAAAPAGAAAGAGWGTTIDLHGLSVLQARKLVIN